MRKLMILMVLVSTMAFTACGQKSKVPAKVKTAFTQKFPDAKKVKWGMEDAKEWEAEFKMDGTEYSANFDLNGTWKETEYEIEKSEIPEAVQETLENEFAGYDIGEVGVSETMDGKVYEIAMEKEETEMEVVISPNGKVVKKVVKKENDEEDND